MYFENHLLYFTYFLKFPEKYPSIFQIFVFDSKYINEVSNKADSLPS